MDNAILWIHGFPLSSAIFEPQREIAGATHLVPDLPGFGGTPAGRETTIDDYARFALEQLDRRGIERATIAGVSMGGYIALAIARLASERVRALMLLDTRETADTEEGRRGRFEMIEKVRARGVEPVVEAMLPKMLTPGAPERLREQVGAIMRSASPEGAIAALRAMADREDSSALLSTIDVPVLVVVGEEDAITPPADAQRMAQRLSNARLVTIASAAHLAHYERPQVFNRIASEFLATL